MSHRGAHSISSTGRTPQSGFMGWNRALTWLDRLRNAEIPLAYFLRRGPKAERIQEILRHDHTSLERVWGHATAQEVADEKETEERALPRFSKHFDIIHFNDFLLY